MKEKLVNYIKEKYEPIAIVLHGSRANGHAREHSDWDFLIFTDKDEEPYRDIQFGANFEVAQVILPIPDSKIKEEFGFYFRKENIEILYDPQNILPSLIDKNELLLKEGNPFPEDYQKAFFSFMKSALNGMGDYKDNSLVVFSKKSDFYSRAVSTWFKSRNQFRPSDYLALPQIEKEDPTFFKLLKEFVSANAEGSLRLGEFILKQLFKNKL